MRELLQRVEARQRESAFILRAHGRVRAAATAERAASRGRLTLDHPGAVRRMIELVGGVRDSSESGMLWDRALTGAITLVGADRGNVQIRHPASGALTIVAQQGFDETFLEHFALVRDTTSACGRAAAQRRQSVVVDVNLDRGFAPHRDVAAASNFRAVLSTPLIDDRGRVRGVLSTHFRQPHDPAADELRLAAWYAELVTAALAAQQLSPARASTMAAARHEQAAARHETAAALMERRFDGGAADRAHQLTEWAALARDRAARERERSLRLLAGV